MSSNSGEISCLGLGSRVSGQWEGVTVRNEVRVRGSGFGVRGSGFGVRREVLELVGLYHDELVELQQACDGGRLAWLGSVVRVRIMVRLMVRVGVRIRV